MKTKLATITVALTLCLGIGVASASPYGSWKARFRPALAQTIADYRTTVTDLGNGYASSAIYDFNQLIADSQRMYNLSNSPDPQTNKDIRAFSVSVAYVATTGKNAINGTGTAAQFQTAVKVMGVFINKLTGDLNRDNARYRS